MENYLEIAECIREKIITGELPLGSEASTVQEIADIMNVHTNRYRQKTAQQSVRKYLSEMERIGYTIKEAIKFINDFEKELT
jgi:DNA-binding transcriptional regulator YhcF (GntR family)